MGFIYKITNNINGKIYIGCSKKLNLNQRYGKNLRRLEREANYYHENTIVRPLLLAVKKYGISNFEAEIIEDNIEEFDLHAKEMEYIIKFNSWAHLNGYNISDNKYSGVRSRNKQELSKKMTKINQYFNFNTNEVFVGSRKEMSLKFGINISKLSRLSSGKILCYKQWCLLSNKNKNFEKDGYYYFYNKNTKTILLLKKHQLIEMFPELNSGALSQLCLRKALKSHKNWIVLDNGDISNMINEDEIFVEIWDNSSKTPIQFKSKKDIKNFIKLNKLGSKFRDMIKGTRKKYRNYCLLDKKDEVFQNVNWINEITNEKFYGTAKEIGEKYFPGCNIGSCFYMIVKKHTGFVSYKGWKVNEKN